MIVLATAHAQLVRDAIQAAQAANDLPAFEIPAFEIKPPKRPEQGDYAASIALQLAKPAGMKPLDVARLIVYHLPHADFVAAVEIAPPGFINFRLDDDWLAQQVEAIITAGSQLFQLDHGKGKRAQVEFVSANPTGPLHIGRSRGAIVGDSIARILEAAGYAVEREYYFNNAGMQMQNLGSSLRIRYLQALGQPVEIPEGGNFYQGDYLIDFARQLVAEHGATWAEHDWQPFKEYAEQKMFGNIRATLKRIEIEHDVFFNENSLFDNGAIWDVMEELDQRGYVYKSVEWEGASEEEKLKAAGKEPATWFRCTPFGIEKDHVLVKSDGTPTYTLPDIAYHKDKLERGFDLAVNILGADHFVQHQVVKAGMQALGLDESKIHVIIMQFVRLIRQGKEVKMSTRRGDYETLDDLIDETSPDAVRYLLLARSPDSRLDFDLDLAVAQNNENPVYYIQNALVRCAGIFRQTAEAGVSDDAVDLSLLGTDELRFLRKALELGDIIEFSALNLEPHKIAFYAHELAGVFHPIYDSVRVLNEDVPADVARARLRFYRAAQVVFKRVLRLMGMSTPEYM
ncbi:MAG: arginine--tRNA ligase [Anaerolineae bacterium]|nr:arginine--tRNA ligase [Anaerolineae bacterium]